MNLAATGAARPEYNTRILHPLVAWLRDHHGEQVVRSIANDARIAFDQLEGTESWVAQEQFETFLSLARALMPDDETFKEACVHRFAEGYGPMRYVLWATTPSAVYAHAEKTYKLVSTVGEPRVLSVTRNALNVRFSSERAISRLNCLVRQAQTTFLPRMWGLPAASLTETSCVALGDEACEYHLRYFDRRRWLPAVVGAALGSALAALAVRFGLGELVPMIALPLLGGSVGFAIEQQRTGKANLAVGEEQNAALRALAAEQAEARRELIAFHQRQRDWDRMLESDAAERAATIQQVIDRIQRTQEVRDRQLRGFSHDLSSPLAVLQMGIDYFGTHARRIGNDAPQIAAELADAILRMQRLLRELMEVATAHSAIAQLTPQAIEVEQLTERLRRRLRAMVYGRDIRSTVFRTREAPEVIEIDPLVLDRITDNLLSNAAKYTDSGSIVVEVDGAPDFLVLKISDSGRGIEPEQIERAFLPGGSDKDARARNSYGVGLSVVVQLLGQIGGRLEVMSKPRIGSTFWIYLPVKASRPSAPAKPQPDHIEEIVNTVVKIRKAKPA